MGRDKRLKGGQGVREVRFARVIKDVRDGSYLRGRRDERYQIPRDFRDRRQERQETTETPETGETAET